MKNFWYLESEKQRTDVNRFVFMTDSPRNVNRRTDELIGDDMAEKVEARMLAGEALSELDDHISKQLTVKTHYGSPLRLRNDRGDTIRGLRQGEVVTFTGETKITKDANGQVRDTDGDGSLNNRHLWFKVRTSSGETGWASAEYLQGSLSAPVTTTEEPLGPDNSVILAPEEPEATEPPAPTEAPEEPLPDTITFTSLPGAADRALRRDIERRRTTERTYERALDREPIPTNGETVSRAEMIASKDFQQHIDTISQQTGLPPERVQSIISDLGVHHLSSPEQITQALDRAGRLHGEDASKVLDSLARIPEAAQFLVAFKHPNVVRFLKGSAVFGGVALHTTFWSRMASAPDLRWDGATPVTGNSVIDTGKYFIPIVGNGFDFTDAWTEAKRGNIGWAAFNVATGTVGLVLDVFSIVTAPTVAGPVAGQSAKAGFKASMRTFKLWVKSGGAKAMATQAGEFIARNTAGVRESLGNFASWAGRQASGIGNAISNSPVGRVASSVGEGLARGRANIGKIWGVRHADNYIRGMEEAATANLATAKAADTSFLGKAGNYLAYGARETVSSLYNILTFKILNSPKAANAAYDAARVDPEKTETETDSGKIERVADGVDIQGKTVRAGDKLIIKDLENGPARANGQEIIIDKIEDGQVFSHSPGFDKPNPPFKVDDLNDPAKFEVTFPRIEKLKESLQRAKDEGSEKLSALEDSLKTERDKTHHDYFSGRNIDRLKTEIEKNQEIFDAKVKEFETKITELEAKHNESESGRLASKPEVRQLIQDIEREREAFVKRQNDKYDEVQQEIEAGIRSREAEEAELSKFNKEIEALKNDQPSVFRKIMGKPKTPEARQAEIDRIYKESIEPMSARLGEEVPEKPVVYEDPLDVTDLDTKPEKLDITDKEFKLKWGDSEWVEVKRNKGRKNNPDTITVTEIKEGPQADKTILTIEYGKSGEAEFGGRKVKFAVDEDGTIWVNSLDKPRTKVDDDPDPQPRDKTDEAEPDKTEADDTTPDKQDSDPEDTDTRERTDDEPEPRDRERRDEPDQPEPKNSTPLRNFEMNYEHLSRNVFELKNTRHVTLNDNFGNTLFRIRVGEKNGLLIRSQEVGYSKSEQMQQPTGENITREFIREDGTSIKIEYRTDGKFFIEKIGENNTGKDNTTPDRRDTPDRKDEKRDDKGEERDRTLNPDDPLSTKWPSELFANRGDIGHLRTSRMKPNAVYEVQRSREQEFQLQTSEDKSARIKLRTTETGLEVEYLRGYDGPKDITEIPPGPGHTFRVDDNTSIHIKVEPSETGPNVILERIDN